MKRQIWRLAVAVSAESEDAVSEALLNVFLETASIYVEMERQRSSAEVYVERKPTQPQLAEFKRWLRLARSCGLSLPAAKIELKPVRRQDWAESWKRHFQPFEVDGRLLVRPSWNKRRAKKDQAVVVLDPGLSFGTGQHPTTRFCLEQIVALRRVSSTQSFLDLGTGSGILAIAAAKIGYAPVHALDFDPEAIRVAASNARQNRVEHKVRLERCDLAKLPARRYGSYDLICANLIYDLLLEQHQRIIRHLQPEGTLVLAGILRSQFKAVCGAYRKAGLSLASRRAEGEWESAAFVRKKKQQVEN